MKIVRTLPTPTTGPSTQLIAIQCDICGHRYNAASRDHTPRIDLDNGDAIIRADLCRRCLAHVQSVLGVTLEMMRPVTKWQSRPGWRSYAYVLRDADSGHPIHCAGMSDEHGEWRTS